jgi:signal transduction histidine kinase
LGRLRVVREAEQPECNALLQEVMDENGSYTGIFVSAPNGDVICSAPPATEPTNASDRPYFQEVLARKELVLGPFVIGRITGMPTLPVLQPVLTDQGEVQAVVSVGLDLNWLERFNRSFGDDDHTLLVFSEDGTILSVFPHGKAAIGERSNAPLIRHVLANPSAGSTQSPGLDGVIRLYGYSPLSQGPENNAYVAVGIPTTQAVAAANRALVRNVSAWVLVIAGLGLAWMLSEILISSRVDRLLHTTQALASGDLAARTGVRKVRGELDHLGQTLDRMAGSLQNQIEERRRAEQRMRHLALQLATAQEEERRALALELHDNAGQVLTALLIHLQLLADQLPPDLEAERERLNEVISLGTSLGEELRTIAHTLRPPLIDRLVLDGALRTLCEELSYHTSLPISYETAEFPPLPDAVAVSCYRFVQEALNNVARHARASQASVSITIQDQNLVVEVSDNGVGFEAESATGLGMLGMRERIESIGGDLTITSNPGQGTRLVARVPL